MENSQLTSALLDQYPMLAVLVLQLIVAVKYVVPLIGEAVSAIVDFKVELACLRDEVRDLREAWLRSFGLLLDSRRGEQQ